MERWMRRIWTKQVFLTLFEHGAIRVFDALNTFVLIRVLSAESYGLFSVYQSWAALLFLFLPSLESALYREYGALRREGRLKRELAAYRRFNLFKLAGAIVMVFALAWIPREGSAPFSYGQKLGLLSFALALPFAQALYGLYREPLRFELKQFLVAMLSASQRVALLATMLICSVVAPGNIAVLTLTALVIYVVFGFVWAAFANRHFGVPYSGKVRMAHLWEILGGTVLWLHINGVLTGFIQAIDTFMLGLARTDLAELGRYGISLKGANFFQILPVALVNSFGVYLGRHQGEKTWKDESRTVLLFTAAFVGLGAALYFGGYLVAEPLLSFLAKGKLDEESLARCVQYFRWQLFGIILLTVTYPLSTWLGARVSVKRIFIEVFLPWTVFASFLYWRIAFGPGLLTLPSRTLASAQALPWNFLAFFLLLLRLWVKSLKNDGKT